MSYGRGLRKNGGPPAWLVFLVGIALVFGIYYVWLGIQNFLRTGGLGVVESTQQAQVISSATADRIRASSTPRTAITLTPIPTCTAFVVSVPSAIVREQPNFNATIVTSLPQNETVCVLGRPQADSEWYTVDSNPRTRRIDPAYMHESVIQAVNPTPTASRTPTALPTVTTAPTLTPTQSPTPRPTETRDPSVTDTPTPSVTPSATPPRQSA